MPGVAWEIEVLLEQLLYDLGLIGISFPLLFQNYLNSIDLIHYPFLVVLDVLCVSVAPAHPSLVVSLQKALLGHRGQSEPQQNRYQGQSE